MNFKLLNEILLKNDLQTFDDRFEKFISFETINENLIFVYYTNYDITKIVIRKIDNEFIIDESETEIYDK